MPDRQTHKVPFVRARGGGLVPRSRNRNGRWRRKRSDAGHPRARREVEQSYAAK
jgi:hypothetical protein